ncbi:MAG: IS481 family transposase [Chloroflexota bacterium]|nr:IS481 family transposase [Chloroflexota bacterium]
MADRVVSMEVRLALANIWMIEDDVPVTVACASLDISRDTYYRYRRRFAADGLEGLLPRSRRPKAHPGQTPPELEALIVAKRLWLVQEGWDAGARSIAEYLTREGHAVPSVRTVHRALVRNDLVEPAPAKRPRSSWKSFEHPAPNSCWQMDGTSWALADGTAVEILAVLDDHSRKVLASVVAGSENSTDAWACVLKAIKDHGRPAMFLTDNGSAFSSRRRRGGMCDFEARLRQLGINPVTSSPYHPQTCGKKEREWATLKRWLSARPKASTVADLAAQVQTYAAYYNHFRPHQSLGQATPDERYAASAKAEPGNQPLPAPMVLSTVRADRYGRIALGGGYSVNLGQEWSYTAMTVLRDDLDVVVFHDNDKIRSLQIDPTRQAQPSGLRRGHRPKESAVPSEMS